MDYYTGKREYFKGIKKIQFEGADSKNPLAYRYYDPEKIVAGKAMKEHLHFAMAWWHTLCADASDPFGSGTLNQEWNQSSDPLQKAKDKADAGFELMTKLGINYYCFHDFDLVQEAGTIEESEKRVKEIVGYLKNLLDYRLL